MISAPNKHFIPKPILSLWQNNIQLPLNSVCALGKKIQSRLALLSHVHCFGNTCFFMDILKKYANMKKEKCRFFLIFLSWEHLECILNPSIVDYGLSSNSRKMAKFFTPLSRNLSKALTWTSNENKCVFQQMKSKYLSDCTCSIQMILWT